MGLAVVVGTTPPESRCLDLTFPELRLGVNEIAGHRPAVSQSPAAMRRLVSTLSNPRHESGCVRAVDLRPKNSKAGSIPLPAL